MARDVKISNPEVIDLFNLNGKLFTKIGLKDKFNTAKCRYKNCYGY